MTALELEFKVHYKELDDSNGPWTGLRFRRLCNLLKLTPEEVSRLLRLEPAILHGYIKKERMPGCVRLTLDMLERSAHRTYLGKVFTKPLFPWSTLKS